MKFLDADETRRRLPFGPLADALADMLRAAKKGEAHAPERLHLSLPQGGVLLVMPASDREVAMVKTVTVHPENPKKGLPAISGEVLAMDAATGTRLGQMDGGAATSRRTAALSLLAARRLAGNSRGPLLCVGAGVQAAAHCQAFHEAFGVKHFFVSARSLDNAKRLAESLVSMGAEAEAVADPNAVLPQCPLVVTATTSHAPVFEDAVREDAFVAAVGAFTPKMAELPPQLVRRATVYADDLDGVKSEAGDLIQANVDWERVVPLAEILDLDPPKEKGPVVFKSVGQALFDLAAARLAFSSSLEKN